jgi:hypothetical protein
VQLQRYRRHAVDEVELGQVERRIPARARHRERLAVDRPRCLGDIVPSL